MALYKAKLEQSTFHSTFFNTVVCWVGTNLSDKCTASILRQSQQSWKMAGCIKESKKKSNGK